VGVAIRRRVLASEEAAVVTVSRAQLVSTPACDRTGIGRYVAEIQRGLRAAGVLTSRAALAPPLPRSVAAAGRRAGYDLDAFAGSYPIRASLTRGPLTHLTSQTLGLLLLSQRLPRPVIVTVHDILPYLLRDDPALSVYRNRLERFVDALAMRGLRRADKIIAVSRHTRSTLIDTLGIAGDRVGVVHHGIDAALFRPVSIDSSFLNRYALTPGGRYVVHVGSEDPRKDVPTLLRAFAILRRDCPDAVLLRIGAPAFAARHEASVRLAADLGVAHAVRWLGTVPDEDLPVFYSLADVFAFPSLYEGFGFPVLEALACGAPVVAAGGGSLEEIAGPAARLVRPGDVDEFARAMSAEMDRSPEARERERAARRAWATTFSWSRAIADTIEIYRAAVSTAPLHGDMPASSGRLKWRT
jgi:glycosyltransferase involved in cell wall biosynthesis